MIFVDAAGIRHNIAASAPGTSDNYAAVGNVPGFSVGSMWFNTATGVLYACTAPGNSGSPNATWANLTGISDESVTPAMVKGGGAAGAGFIPSKNGADDWTWLDPASLSGGSTYNALTDVQRSELAATGDTLSLTATEAAFRTAGDAANFAVAVPFAQLTAGARFKGYLAVRCVANPSIRPLTLFVHADNGTSIELQPALTILSATLMTGDVMYWPIEFIVHVAGVSGILISTEMPLLGTPKFANPIDLATNLTLTLAGFTDGGTDLQIAAERLFIERIA